MSFLIVTFFVLKDSIGISHFNYILYISLTYVQLLNSNYTLFILLENGVEIFIGIPLHCLQVNVITLDFIMTSLFYGGKI